MKPIIVFGTGKIAEVVYYYLKHESEFEVKAFTCDSDYIADELFAGLPVLPFEEITATHPPEDYAMFIALGYQDLNRTRAQRVAQARSMGYTLISYVHRDAGLPADTEVGENCFIMNQTHIQPKVSLGDNVFVWSGALVGHHSTVGDNCWVTSTASICGQVTLGKNVFIGANATIGNDLRIGDNCLLGSNTLITKDLQEGAVVVEKSSEVLRINSEQFLRMSKFH